MEAIKPGWNFFQNEILGMASLIWKGDGVWRYEYACYCSE